MNVKNRLVRFVLGSAVATGLVVGADVVLNKTSETNTENCIYTTEWINENGMWEKHNSYNDYETLFRNGVIQKDNNGIMLYYIVPFNSNGQLLDTIEFNSYQIKGSRNCN